MRRLAFVFMTFYLMFIGGSAYYTLIFPVRVFHHIAITLVLGLWLILRIRSGRGLPHTPLNNALFATIGVWIVTAILSIDPRVAFENIWFPITHLIIFFILLDMFQSGYHRLVMESTFIMGTLVIFITGIELASWYFGLGIIPGTSIGWVDIGVLMPQELYKASMAMNISTLLAGFVTPLIILALTWAFTTYRHDYRRVLFVLAGLLIVVLVLTFSRGGLIAFLAGISTMIVIRAAQSPKVMAIISPRLLISASIAAGIIIMIVLVVVLLPYGKGVSDDGRLDMWRSAVEITADHPINGVGPGLFGRSFRSERDPLIARDKLASAHNAYLNILSETGVIGAAVSVWLGVIILRAVWNTHKNSTSHERRIRVEGAFAAVVAIAVHSMFDAFTTTPLVLVFLVALGYSMIGHRSRLDERRYSNHRILYGLLVIVLGYGIWLVVVSDQAQNHYMASLSNSGNSESSIQSAIDIDPQLRLYHLQSAYLSGLNDDTQAAISAYENAVTLEPTWDIGWINLAALAERKGNLEEALNHLQVARKINELNTAAFHWARISEQIGTAESSLIANAYISALNSPYSALPLSEFWWETALRREVVQRFIADAPLDIQYAVLAEHDLSLAEELIPANPQTAAEWWIYGEHTLHALKEHETAHQAFSKAIELNAVNGDYYVSRAESLVKSDPTAANLDLDRASVYGTRLKNLNAVRAMLAVDPDEKRKLQIAAVAQVFPGQAFAAVLYAGRPSVFNYLPEMRWPGRGRTYMSPWYDLAYTYLEAGERDEAKRVFDAILEIAPYESEAEQQLAAFE